MLIGVRGILSKEIRSRSRGLRPMLLLTFYLGVLTLAVLAVLGLSETASGGITRQLGQQLFATLVAGSLLLVAFIAPALTAGTISGERERRTLDLLLVTRASSLGLVAGKLSGALLWILYLFLASLPAFGIVYLFGGVPLAYVGVSALVVLATALQASSLGLVLSALTRRTMVATVTSYFLVLVTCVGVPIFGLSIIGAMLVSAPFAATAGAPQPEFGWPPGYYWAAFASPPMAIYSVLSGLFTSSGFGFVSGVSPVAVYSDRFDFAPGQTPVLTLSLAPWVFHSLVSVGFAAIALLLSTASLREVPLRRRRRAR